MRFLFLAAAIAYVVWLLTRDQTTSDSSAFSSSGGRSLPFSLPPDVDALIQQKAALYGVDPDVIRAQAWEESRGNQSAKSKAGAIGVMQLMPGTAADLGVNPYILEDNIDGGVRYFSGLLNQFGGDTSKALAAYNLGPGRVSRAGDWYSQIPGETSDYLSRIFGDLGWDQGAYAGGF